MINIESQTRSARSRNFRSGSIPRRGLRRAFTLIELLIVVVIIGILAAIAIPKFAATKGKANFAAMRSDLHNLSISQEAYFYENREYASDLAALGFKASRGVVVTIVEADAVGWSATSVHPESHPHFCATYFGDADPVDPATQSGVVACK